MTSSSSFSAARLSLALAVGLVLAAAAPPAHAAFPGVPGPIAYTKGISTELEGTTGGLFAHGPRQSDPSRRLTPDPYDTAPSYSANGRLVVFARVDLFGSPAPSHIYVMNADGSGVRQLTDGDAYDSNPSFSPNGRQVVFDRRRGSQVYSIYAINLDGSGERQLTHGAYRDQNPVFAPNGKWIAFVSNRDKDARSDQSDIFSMRADGSRLQVLIDGPHDESDPDISPDGRSVVFASNRNRRTLNIFVARSSGRRVRALTHADDTCFGSVCFYSPAWAPDGKHIAFIASSRYSTELEVMRSDGRRHKEFANGTTETEGYGTSVGAPAWGPKPR